jgi:hypothetical protein
MSNYTRIRKPIKLLLSTFVFNNYSTTLEKQVFLWSKIDQLLTIYKLAIKCYSIFEIFKFYKALRLSGETIFFMKLKNILWIFGILGSILGIIFLMYKTDSTMKPYLFLGLAVIFSLGASFGAHFTRWTFSPRRWVFADFPELPFHLLCFSDSVDAGEDKGRITAAIVIQGVDRFAEISRDDFDYPDSYAMEGAWYVRKGETFFRCDPPQK